MTRSHGSLRGDTHTFPRTEPGQRKLSLGTRQGSPELTVDRTDPEPSSGTGCCSVVPKLLITSSTRTGIRGTSSRCGGGFAEQVARNVENGEATTFLRKRLEIRLDENLNGLFAGINLDTNGRVAKFNLVASSIRSSNDGVGHCRTRFKGSAVTSTQAPAALNRVRPRNRSTPCISLAMERQGQLAITVPVDIQLGYPPSRFRGMDISGLPRSWTTSSVPPLGLRVRLASPLSQAKVLPPPAATVDRRSSL
jgi:hypothetical protein